MLHNLFWFILFYIFYTKSVHAIHFNWIISSLRQTAGKFVPKTPNKYLSQPRASPVHLYRKCKFAVHPKSAHNYCHYVFSFHFTHKTSNTAETHNQLGKTSKQAITQTGVGFGFSSDPKSNNENPWVGKVRASFASCTQLERDTTGMLSHCPVFPSSCPQNEHGTLYIELIHNQ